MQITPTERHYLLEFLIEEAKEHEEMIQKHKAEREANSQNSRSRRK